MRLHLPTTKFGGMWAIKVKQDGKYWRVLDYDFKPVEPPTIIELSNEEWNYAF